MPRVYQYSDESGLLARLRQWVLFLLRKPGGPFKSQADLARAMMGPESEISYLLRETPGRGAGLVFFNRLRRVIQERAGFSASFILENPPPAVGAQDQPAKKRTLSAS